MRTSVLSLSRFPIRLTRLMPLARPAMLAAMLPFAAGATVLPGGHYHFDQSNASIQFRLAVAGVLHPKGDFRRFEGDLAIDASDLDASTIAVRLDSGAVDIALPGGGDRMRSADYFDSAHFPDITFRSTRLTRQASGHIQIEGILTIRGVDHVQTLDAAPAHADADTPSTDDFVIRGSIARSDFGMVADRHLVSNDIRLTIRVALPQAAR